MPQTLRERMYLQTASLLRRRYGLLFGTAAAAG